MSSQKTRFSAACIAGLLGLSLTTTTQAIVINEVRIDQPGPDRDEYFELAGIAGESLDGLSYLVLGDSRQGKSGVIESVTNLDGLQLASNGYFLAVESSFSLGSTANLVTSLNFENNDNVTHLLVRNFSAQKGDDLDTNDDGLLDIIAWDNILDSLALVKSFSNGEEIYSSTQIGTGDGTVPVHAFRNPANQGAWQTGGPDTAGQANATVSVPEPGTLALLVVGILAWRYRPGKGDSHLIVPTGSSIQAL